MDAGAVVNTGTADSDETDPVTDMDPEPVAQPVLTLTKALDPATVLPALPGGTLIYTLTYQNTGNADATGVVLTDAVPAFTTFTSASPPGTETAGLVTWLIGTVAAGTSGSVTLTVTLDSVFPVGTTPVSNSAAATGDSPLPPVPPTPPVVTNVTVIPLVITANPVTKTYDGEPLSGFSVLYDGFQSGDNPSVLGGTLAFGGASQTAVDVGTYSIVPSGQTSSVYGIEYVDGTSEILPASLTVVANDQTKMYGDQVPSLDGTLTGAVATDNITASYATTATASSDVGIYPITATLADPDNRLGNYTVTTTDGTLTITKAPLTVTADDATREVGEPNPPFTVSYSGFVNGETLATSGVMGSPVLTTVATATDPAGTYPIVATQGHGHLGGGQLRLCVRERDADRWGHRGAGVDPDEDGRQDRGEPRGHAGVYADLLEYRSGHGDGRDDQRRGTGSHDVHIGERRRDAHSGDGELDDWGCAGRGLGNCDIDRPDQLDAALPDRRGHEQR